MKTISEVKFTPGPWRTGDIWQTVFGPKTDQPSPVIVCQLPTATHRVSEYERRANARLIAAAPELFDACQSALATLERISMFPQLNDVATITKLKAAITSATKGTA